MMKNRKHNIKSVLCICLLSFLSFFPAWSQEEIAGEEKLREYLIIAAENNPELKTLFKKYQAALEEEIQVGVLPDPQVSFGYMIQPVETRVGPQEVMASASQMFPWFGTLDAQQRVALEKAKAMYQVFENKKLELFKDIRITYNELYYTQAALEVTKKNLQLLESFLGISEVQFEGGRTGFSSVLQVQIEKQELQRRVELLIDNLIPLNTRMEQLLNVKLEDSIVLPQALWEEQLELQKEEIFQVILENSPRLEQVAHEIKSYEEQRDVAQKLGMPSFTLGASYTLVGERPTDPTMAIPDNGQDVFIFPQVGIKIPLYRKKYRSMKQEANLMKEAAESSYENLENILLTQLEEIYRDYIDSRRRATLYSELSQLAEQSLELAQTELITGSNSLYELIRIERQVLNYKLELARARVELNNNIYRMNYLMGKQ